MLKANDPTVGGQPARKRFLKEALYLRLPSRLRPALYFSYRYFLGLGFLDGKPGFFFHFLQAFWYRTLVEAKVLETEQMARSRGLSAVEMLERDGVIDKPGQAE